MRTCCAGGREGVPRMTTTLRRGPWTPAELALLRERYPELGAKAVARLLGRPRRNVKSTAQRLGVRFAGYRAVDQERAVRLWARGHTHVEIARRLGVSEAGVWHALTRAGVAGPGAPARPGPHRPSGSKHPAWR